MAWVRAFAVLLLMGFGLATAAAQAPGKRVALVIGNGAYQFSRVLPNAVNDAQLVADALRRANFAVEAPQINAGVGAMRQALRRFQQQAAGAEVAFVYYAGHSLEESGANWLIPVDAQVVTWRDLEYEAIPLKLALDAVQTARIGVVALDACRDNPLGDRMTRSAGVMRSNAPSGALAQASADGVMIMFATAPGRTAADGDGRNSPFAQALAKWLPTPGEPLQNIGNRVRDEVKGATQSWDRPQTPFVNASITGDFFYLIPRTASPVIAPAPDPAVQRRLEEAEKRIRELEAQKAAPPTSQPTVTRPDVSPPAPAAPRVSSPAPQPTRGNTPWVEGANPVVLATLRGHTDTVRSAAFSPDGARIVTASRDASARLWDAATGRLLLRLSSSDEFMSAAFSPDGRRIVTASWDKTASVWDVATGRLLLTLSGHTIGLGRAAFSPNDARIVTAGYDSTACIWDAATGRLLLTLSGHANPVTSAAFSPDGARIVTASWDHTARVWDAATGRLLLTLSGHTGNLWGAAFSTDGARIATASEDDTVRVWDVATGRLLLTLSGHTSTVYTADFSPDGRRIVTASTDKTARVWDATTGRLLLTLNGHAGEVLSAAFSPDGARIVTASGDKTARVWGVR